MQTEKWVEQYLRLRRAYAVFPSCFPKGIEDRIRFIEMAVKPSIVEIFDTRTGETRQCKVYLKGQKPGQSLYNVREEQIYSAGRRIYNSSRQRLEELAGKIAAHQPGIFDSFQLLSLMEEHDLRNERGRIADVTDAVDEKMRMLTRQQQKEVLDKYGFHMYDSFWQEYDKEPEPRHEQFQLV
jgi:hypothetical protein